MMKRWITMALAALLLTVAPIPCSHAEEAEDVWTMVTQEGQKLTSIATAINVGDEYIAQDNRAYKVIAADAQTRTATAQEAGAESPVSQAFFTMRKTAVSSKRIGLYCTHSDESYENGDGTSSNEQGWSGIHDVAATLKSWLEDKDIQVEFNTDSFLPHDAGAYRRSRAAMTELVRSGPSAIFDIHRDGIPDRAEYETEVNGEKVTMVRLLVGRSNPNSTENKRFAVQLKSVADEYYPGLVKDIFIGKGNYNQELMPDSVLLEFGTHTSDKQQVLASTQYMADVISMTVFGSAQGYSKKAERESAAQPAPNDAVTPAPGADPSVAQQSASTEAKKQGSSGVWIAIAVIVSVAILALMGFGVMSGGGFAGFGDRVKRFSSEVTGGLFGKHKKE